MNGVVEFILRVFIPIHQLLVTTTSHKFIGGDFEEGDQNDDEGKCELVGTFSLVTQAFLGLLCMSSLIVKRYYEWPVRRTWAVWFFDVSKQLLGALGVHVFNVVLSIIETLGDSSENGDARIGLRTRDDDGGGWEDGDANDPCNWYFLNIVFDCTIGVYILYLVFSGVNKICKNWLHIANIKTGEYGDPNRPSVTAYLKQLVIYFISLMITKVILFVVLDVFSLQLLWITDHVLLVWLNNYPKQFEIFMVMFVIPIIMNCLQFILVDNIIQNPYFRIRNKEDQREVEEQRREQREDSSSTSLSQETNSSKQVTTYGTFDA